MAHNQIRIVVLLSPDPGGLWYGRVVCDQGPVALSPLMTYEQQRHHTAERMEEMVRLASRPARIEVWTVITTEENAAEWVGLDGSGDVFERIAGKVHGWVVLDHAVRRVN